MNRGPDTEIVIRIKRHLTGPPRRTPGQVIRLTRAQVRAQGLRKGRDYDTFKP